MDFNTYQYNVEEILWISINQTDENRYSRHFGELVFFVFLFFFFRFTFTST